jgi:hypothetical protein
MNIYELSKAKVSVYRDNVHFYLNGRLKLTVSFYTNSIRYCHLCNSYHCDHIKQALMVKSIHEQECKR